MDCPLCSRVTRAAAGHEPELVWSFPSSVAFLGPWQRYLGYCVLVSRRHATELSGLSETERREYLDEMCLLARAIEAEFAPRKMNYELLGNQVPHLHWHLFPRPSDDPEPLRPVWFAIDQAERDEENRARLAAGSISRSETIARIQAQLQRLTGL